jgi:hypothetical protein
MVCIEPSPSLFGEQAVSTREIFRVVGELHPNNSLMLISGISGGVFLKSSWSQLLKYLG